VGSARQDMELISSRVGGCGIDAMVAAVMVVRREEEECCECY